MDGPGVGVGQGGRLWGQNVAYEKVPVRSGAKAVWEEAGRATLSTQQAAAAALWVDQSQNQNQNPPPPLATVPENRPLAGTILRYRGVWFPKSSLGSSQVHTALTHISQVEAVKPREADPLGPGPNQLEEGLQVKEVAPRRSKNEI